MAGHARDGAFPWGGLAPRYLLFVRIFFREGAAPAEKETGTEKEGGG